MDFWKDKNKWSTLKSAKATALTAYQSSVHAVVAKYWNADRSPTDVQILIVCRYNNITHSLENLVSLYIAVHPDTRLLNFFHLQLKWSFFYVSGHRFSGKKKKPMSLSEQLVKTSNCFVNIRHLDPVTEMFWDYTSNMFTQHSTISLKQITVAGKFTLALLICKKKVSETNTFAIWRVDSLTYKSV